MAQSFSINSGSCWTPGAWMGGSCTLMPPHVPNPDRSPTVQVNLKHVIDDMQCYPTVCALRWPDGFMGPSCQSKYSIKGGCDDTALVRQCYELKDCDTRFDPLFHTIHVSLRYFEVSIHSPLQRRRRCDPRIALTSRPSRHCTARRSEILSGL